MRRSALILVALALVGGGILAARPAAAATTAERYAGNILLQYERSGQTWYVYPVTKQKYYLGHPTAALRVMQHLSLGINNADLAKIPIAGSTSTGDLSMRTRLSGRFLLAVQDHGKIWYVRPANKQRYLINSSTAAFWVMGHLSIGAANATLNAIPTAAGFGEPTPVISGLRYGATTVSTSRGQFLVDVLTLDRATWKIKTDTGNGSDCSNGCTTLSLLNYVNRRSALAGMNGTYFCPSDYASCAGQTGSYFYPVFNSFNRVMINGDRLKYGDHPMITIDLDNVPRYYPHAKDILGDSPFTPVDTTNIQAAIGNSPSLIENGQNILNTSLLDSKQATVRSNRGGFGWAGTTYYLFIAHGATVIDLAAVAKALNLDFALNLDGGGSSAMYANGRYTVGPGRNLPNVILVTR